MQSKEYSAIDEQSRSYDRKPIVLAVIGLVLLGAAVVGMVHSDKQQVERSVMLDTGLGVVDDTAHPLHNRVFLIANLGSGLVFDVHGSSKIAGAKVIQWRVHCGNNQKFRFVAAAAANAYYIQNVNSGLVLDISGAGKQSGARLIQWTKHGKGNQVFLMHPLHTGAYRIQVQHSSKYLDVPFASNTAGVQIQQWDDLHWAKGNRAQEFLLIPEKAKSAPKPTPRPTLNPTKKPTRKPTPKPTKKPTKKPTAQESGRYVACCNTQVNFNTGSWQQARQACVKEGDDAATIYDAAQNTRAASACKRSQGCWIGLKSDAKGKFTWMDGNAMTYNQFGTGEPKSRVNVCVLIDPQGQWKVAPCTASFPTICEVPPGV